MESIVEAGFASDSVVAAALCKLGSAVAVPQPEGPEVGATISIIDYGVTVSVKAGCVKIWFTIVAVSSRSFF